MGTQKALALFRLTIGTKLVSLIAVLLLGSVVGLVWVSTRMFTEDNTALIQKMNSDTASSLATRVRDGFEGITNRMRMLGTILVQDSVTNETRARLKAEFFSKDKDFLLLAIQRDVDTASPQTIAVAGSPDLNSMGDADGAKTLAAALSEKEFSVTRIARGEALVATLRLPDGGLALALGLPFIAAENTKDRFTHILTAVVRITTFAKAFAESDIITSYMVDHRGRLLAHPDANRASSGESMAQIEIVRQMLEGKFNNGQTRYLDPQTGEARLGAFHLVGFGSLGVVSEVPEAKAFEAAQSVKTKSTYIALIILCLAFLMGYLYSGTITRPIKTLVEAARKISQGDFAIDLKPRSRDEIATLSLAFNDMAKGLEERDRVKETFNKFHNKEIAEKLLSGEVKLGGERKKATIFFSDVRGFTAMSETMEPEQVVEMLNEYMTRMVAIIRAHKGIVDKYVGDAIMAIWGVPLPGEDDAYSAVRACIAMREELSKLNELRISRGQTALKIGMGLNTGSVIAGNIGSNEKMEYTVIGDAVNLASRMESMTKEYGTDFLIPQSIYDEVHSRFVFEKRKSARVKGKAQAIEVYTVAGYIDEAGQEVIVKTPYSSYESEKSDKGVHDESPETGITILEGTSTGFSIAELSETKAVPVPPPFNPGREVTPPPFHAPKLQGPLTKKAA
ncbi:adenylate/guanylate cyclase domain-containing protein [Bdellovibrionota bacterium FG-1]